MAYGAGEAIGGHADQDAVRAFSWLAFLGAAASVALCYLTKLTGAVAPLIGADALTINPHLQAFLMCALAAVAVFAILRDRRLHGEAAPLLMGGLGLLVITGALYLHYDERIETFGYIVLIVATFLNQRALLGRLNETVTAQASELAALNASLEARVDTQVEEIDRLARLKRFLAPEVADLITNAGDESLLESHRGFVACIFCDIRNFTSLSDGIEPEEVMQVLQAFHGRIGGLVGRHGATIGYRSGDGFMAIVNDPQQVEKPNHAAIELARAMEREFESLRGEWRRLGYEIGFGVGVASGYATLGVIGDERRYDYTAIGNVINLAARLCDIAHDGEILMNRRAYADLQDDMPEIETLGAKDIRGFDRPVEIFRDRQAPPSANDA